MTAPLVVDRFATFYAGDCVAVMAELPAASVDAIVTDPPYGLEFMGKEWAACGKANCCDAPRRTHAMNLPVITIPPHVARERAVLGRRA